jgi:hypothetical protein
VRPGSGARLNDGLVAVCRSWRQDVPPLSAGRLRTVSCMRQLTAGPNAQRPGLAPCTPTNGRTRGPQGAAGRSTRGPPGCGRRDPGQGDPAPTSKRIYPDNKVTRASASAMINPNFLEVDASHAQGGINFLESKLINGVGAVPILGQNAQKRLGVDFRSGRSALGFRRCGSGGADLSCAKRGTLSRSPCAEIRVSIYGATGPVAVAGTSSITVASDPAAVIGPLFELAAPLRCRGPAERRGLTTLS